MSTMVYQYGVLPPTEGASIVREQLWLAHRYYNQLIEYARGRRAAEREVEAQSGLDVEVRACSEARSALDAALVSMCAARQRASRPVDGAARPRRPDAATDRAAVRELRAVVRETSAALRERRAALRAEMQPTRDAIHERWLWLRRATRAVSGLRHGTYTAIEDAVERACSDTPLWDDGRPSDPRFKRWTGEGLVGVQIQGGATEAQMRGEHTQVRIGPPSRGWQSDRYATLWLRVGSQPDRSPVWAIWPMKLHRPLPEGAVVKRAYVHVRRLAWQERWTCEFTVDVPEAAARVRHGSGAVGVDIGWRDMGDGLRVAVWRDEGGDGGELRVPRSVLERVEHSESIRSIRDRRLEKRKRWLCAWRRRLGAGWLAEHTEHAHAWRSWARMVSLRDRWRREAPEHEPVLLRSLDRACHHDRHLWVWEARERSRALGHRRELYRVCAARLAERYGTIVLEDFDLRRFARSAPTERDQARPDEAPRLQRVRAACSELRQAIETAARSRGTAVVRVDPAHTTDTCHVHGAALASDAGEDVTVRYSCGCVADQDEHAARALLVRWRERSGDAPPGAGARKRRKRSDAGQVGETRWQRVARQRLEKEARMGTARNAVANGASS